MAGRAKSPHNTFPHCNGNLIAAVDVETTGTQPGYHEVIQVAVLPLNAELRPLKSVIPFYLNITPENLHAIDPKACKVHKRDLADLILKSINKWKAADLFDEWFEKLNLPVTNTHHKRILPLWSNGSAFDKPFLIEWLGKEHYDHIFGFHERDTQALALSINDRFFMHGERVPFPKVGLNSLAATLGVVNDKPHDALYDCITTAEVYRRMLLMYHPTVPGAVKPQEVECADQDQGV